MQPEMPAGSLEPMRPDPGVRSPVTVLSRTCSALLAVPPLPSARTIWISKSLGRPSGRMSWAVRAAMIGAYILLVEWMRAVASTFPGAAIAAVVLGGAALALTAIGFSAARLGLGTSRLWLRILGGMALAAVLLLPASLALVAMTISVTQE